MKYSDIIDKFINIYVNYADERSINKLIYVELFRVSLCELLKLQYIPQLFIAKEIKDDCKEVLKCGITEYGLDKVTSEKCQGILEGCLIILERMEQ